jgi:hypothetical protein
MGDVLVERMVSVTTRPQIVAANAQVDRFLFGLEA